MSQQREQWNRSRMMLRSGCALLAGLLLAMIGACGAPGGDQPPPEAQQTVTQGIDLGYGPDLFYYLRHDPSQNDFSTFGTISTSGAVVDRFGVGLDFDALTFVAKDLGYGPNLFYYLRHDPSQNGFSTFGTISTSGAVVDRFGVGYDFDALTFVAKSVGYGTKLFYYLRHDPNQYNWSTYGTISTSGAVVDRFGAGYNVDALTFVENSVGYGPDLFYWVRHDPSQYNWSTFGTLSTSGAVVDRFGVGYDFDALAFPVSSPLVAADLSVSLAEDGMASISLSCTGADGDPLSYVIVTPPQHGVLSGTGATWTYAPAADYNGADRFEYRCQDGAAESNLAVVSLMVTPVNDPPSVPELSAPEDGARVSPGDLSIVWLASSDVDGDGLTYRVEIERGGRLVFAASTSATELHLSGAQALCPGRYSWRVEAIDAATASSGFSPARTFKVTGPVGRGGCSGRGRP